MSRLFLAIFIATIVCVAATTTEAPIKWTEDQNVLPEPFYNYGTIIESHNIRLPNYDNSGFHHYYVVSNLPAQRTETIYHFAALFTVLDPEAEANTPAELTLHVVRPHAASPAEAAAGAYEGVTFIKSATIAGFVSGVRKNVYAAGLVLEAGDYLVLSVPNDAVRLHVGDNNLGITIPYGVIEIPSGLIPAGQTSPQPQYATTFKLSTPPEGHTPAPGHFLQICTIYGTFGPKNNKAESSVISMFAGGDDQIIVGGVNDRITEFVVGIVHGRTNIIGGVQYGGNTEYVGPVRVELQVASPCGFDLLGEQLWCHTPTAPGALVPNHFEYLVQAQQIHVTNKELKVADGDRVGIRLVMVPGGSLIQDQYDLRIAFTNAHLNPPVPFVWYAKYPDESVLAKNDLSTDTASFSFTLSPTGFTGLNGDPQFAGFQGQSFQFHGLADEHFNLISTPSLQLNSHFVYLSSGKCDYNNTMCFQHPGTYVDALGFIIPSASGDVHISMVAGSHQAGLRVWIGTSPSELKEIRLGERLRWSVSNHSREMVTLTYHHSGEVQVDTELFTIDVVNSDYFFNLGMSLKNLQMLRIGSAKHTVTDRATCDQDRLGYAGHAAGNHGAAEAALLKKYHSTPIAIHGLIGQTWRNAKVCGKQWMGAVQDYVVSDLFSGDYHFNMFAKAA